MLASIALSAAVARIAPMELASAPAAASREIVVTGTPDARAQATSTATRTDTDIKDIPQALTIVSAAQIEDRSIRSIADLLLFVPGASASSGEGNRDQMVLRGNGSTADFFVDGVRDDAQYLRDLYDVERVEVLRGANAMIFGRGGGGGVVNRVRKTAAPGSFADLAGAIDSEGGARLTADINHGAGATVAGRINAMYERGRSFREAFGLIRYGISPTVRLRPGDSTRIDLSYAYANDRRTADRGVPSVTDPASLDRPLTGHDSVFFGDPDLSVARVDGHVATIAVERKLGTGLTLRSRLSAARFDKFYQNVFASNLDEATGTVVLAGYNSRNDRSNLFDQTDLVWKTAAGGVEQTLLIGTEWGRQTSRNLRATAVFAAGRNIVPLSDPSVSSGATFAATPTDSNNRTSASVAAIYIQDQIRFTPGLELIAGVRVDRFALAVDDRRAVNLDFRRVDRFVSPRIGLIAKPTATLSLYASYGRSYLPQSGDQFSSLDASTAALKPERFDNYEVGAKWEPVAGLLATAALYRLDRTNTRAADPLDPTRVVLTGAQRSRGLELGLERSVGPGWKMTAGYSWQKAEIVETTAAALAGREVPLVPRHSLSLWNRVEVDRRLGVGAGMIARSRSFTTISNQVILPAYARVDGALFYKITPRIQAQVNAENLLGAHYFATANSDNNIAPGAPRTVRATLRLGL